MFNGDTPFSTHSHSDFPPSSEVATMWQTDGAACKLKPRSFHKSTHLWVHSVDFHPGVNHAWHSSSLILILIYSLYAIINSAIFNNMPSKIWGFATSIPPLLPLSLATFSLPPTSPTSRAWICACIAANCFYCCLMISCKLIWLILL